MYLIVLSAQIQANFFSDIYDRYIKKWSEETIQHTYELEGSETLIVDIPHGDIKIKGWHGNTIMVTTHKQAPSKEHLPSIVLKKTKESPTILKLSIHYLQPTTKGVADLTLLVPKHLHISLTTQQGAIHVEQLNGNATASTKHGSISLQEINGTLIAHAQQGTISIKKAHNNVKASTHHGNITIHDTYKSVIASTHSGSLDVTCKQLTSQSVIQLSSTTGNISLGLPEDVNVDLYASTNKGNVTCDHFITTKPQTMQLNNKTWQRLKREVNGIIGSGETQVKLTSTNSSIKIRNTSIQKTLAA
jgi:DUF4097 and DUF4098 domain-containing protein YvlB